MLKLKDFKDKGYSVYRTNKASSLEKDWASWLLQKKFIDSISRKTKYFINVYVSDYRLWNLYNSFNTDNFPIKRKFVVKLQMYRGEDTFDISITRDKEFQGIGDIESLVEEIWAKMTMDYDHHN